MMPKYVYRFSEGDKDQKDLLGGKGANLAEMTRLGLPVPPGFTITTDACRAYLADGAVPDALAVQVTTALREVEEELGRELGAAKDPLLVSVRSGAKFSMPGMMETVLNIGLNDESVKGLAETSGDERFAWDSYRRLIQMFGKTVLDIDGEHFSAALDAKKAERGVKLDYELDVDALRRLVEQYKAIVREQAGIGRRWRGRDCTRGSLPFPSIPQHPSASRWCATRWTRPTPSNPLTAFSPPMTWREPRSLNGRTRETCRFPATCPSSASTGRKRCAVPSRTWRRSVSPSRRSRGQRCRSCSDRSMEPFHASPVTRRGRGLPAPWSLRERCCGGAR